jgi:hypothetical protein
MNAKSAKALRTLAIVLLAITAAWTLISGIGTTCVAFNAEQYDSMSALIPYKGIYQAFVFLTIAVAVAAIVMTVGLARGKQWGYIGGLIALVAGLIVGGAHMYYSNMLRGSTMPAGLRVYLSILAMVALLILRIPSIWKTLFKQGNASDAGGVAPGLAMILSGIVVITAPLWVGTTHVFDGRNWSFAFLVPMITAGLVLIGTGAIVLTWKRLEQHALRRHPCVEVEQT